MTRKQKRALTWVGTTVVMYLAIKYIMPLVVPFVVAGIVAKMFLPLIKWIHKKTRLSETVAIVFVLVIMFVVGGGLIYFLGNLFIEQLLQFADHIPSYVQNFTAWFENTMENWCCQTERFMHLEQGSLIREAQGAVEHVAGYARDSIVQWVMDNWMICFGFVIEVGAFFVILFVATIYWIKEREIVAEAKEKSIFKKEINLIISETSRVGCAYLKVEGSIMLITTIICVVGLWLMKNPYSILVGVGIGILDALPFFGTGTVFIPWILILLLYGRWKKALFLLILYLICYFVREFMESKLLGNRIGITAIETMISIYVGLKLFGVIGLFIGPIVWILIKEIDKNIFLE